MYELTTRPFETFDHKQIVFSYRLGTNDFNTIPAIIQTDEYGFRIMGLKPGDAVLDLGAHIGAVTCFLHYLNPYVLVHAYEPLPENFELLQKNVAQNRAVNSHLHQKAVIATNDPRTKIHYTTDKTEVGRHHRYIGRPMKPKEIEWDEKAYIVVDATTLEQIIIAKRLEKIKCVKMDIEGVEAEVLKNTHPEILKRIEYITGEYHGMTADDIYEPVKEFFDNLKTPFPEKMHIGHFLFRRRK